jgi:hypothetical protein
MHKSEPHELYELAAYSTPETTEYPRTPFQPVRCWRTRFGRMPLIVKMVAPNRLCYLNLLQCHMVTAMRGVHHLPLPKVRRTVSGGQPASVGDMVGYA